MDLKALLRSSNQNSSSKNWLQILDKSEEGERDENDLEGITHTTAQTPSPLNLDFGDLNATNSKN
jgi:hypothetical protein